MFIIEINFLLRLVQQMQKLRGRDAEKVYMNIAPAMYITKMTKKTSAYLVIRPYFFLN